jgi:class 3 adenylate cyclase
MQFTVTGTAVNHTERYCSGAAGGEILLSQQLWQRTYRLVDTEMVEIPTKHEGAFQAFRVKGLRTTGKL